MILIAIAIIAFNELFVHLFPLSGATGEDLDDYSKYPVMEVVLPTEDLDSQDPDAKGVYCVEWDEANIIQDIDIKITFDASGKLTSYDQIEVVGDGYCTKMLFGYANIYDGVAYVNVVMRRKTWVWPHTSEQFGFAIKIAE